MKNMMSELHKDELKITKNSIERYKQKLDIEDRLKTMNYIEDEAQELIEQEILEGN